MRSIWLDLRHAIKSMLRAPGFTAVAVFSLALGIGTNAAVFTVFNSVLLRPLPYRDPGQLVAVFETNPKQGASRVTVCPPDFLDWQRELSSLEQPAAYRQWEPNLTGVEVPERLTGMRVTGDFFSLLGVSPVAGRVLGRDDERANTFTVVISQGLWRRQFGADPKIVGRTMVLNGDPHVVAGIMPDSFQFPHRAVEIWGPLNLDRERNDRAEHSLRVVARLRHGAAIGGARAELATLMSRQGPENEGDSADLVPLRDWYVGATSRTMLWGLLGAVALLLLTSCANVANLALARGTGRVREMMIRTAIGATRPRLISQLVIESIALSIVAGMAGLLFAMWTADVLVASLPPTSVYRMAPLAIDWRVLLFTFVVAGLAGLLFGIAPALRHSDARFSAGQLATRAPSGSLQRFLLVAQTALAVTLIAGAGLLARSFVRLWSIEPGFSSQNVMAARISVPSTLPESRQIEFFAAVVRNLEANPAVAAAGAVTFLPLSGEGSGGFITFEGREAMSAESGSRPGAGRLIVTPGYFDALRLRLKEGRFLNDQDTTAGLPVVVVNDAMARRYWPGESPVGKRIKRGTPTAKFPWMTVVGVVEDVRQMNLVDPVGSTIYIPLTQFPSSAMSLTVRTTVPDSAATALVRSAVRAVDANQPIAWITPLDELVFGSLGGRWLPLLWMSVFAGLSLVLAGLGVYGVVSYVVEQRRREFGIRMALGADRGNLVRLAIRHGLGPALGGAILGLAFAVVLARLNSTLFAGVATFDAPAFLTATAILAIIALAASYAPARRIANDDAAMALRSE